MNSNARKLAEEDENLVKASGVPYSIIRTGTLKNSPGGQQGFCFEEVAHFFMFKLTECSRVILGVVPKWKRELLIETNDA